MVGRRGWRRVRRRRRLTRRRYAASRRRRNLMFNDITLIGAVTESALTINLRVCLSCRRPGPPLPSPPNLDLCVYVCVCVYVQQRSCICAHAPRVRVFRVVVHYRFTDRLLNEKKLESL